jgi:divalent metal cation (Fe/Co/Zn/Cd) transporter
VLERLLAGVSPAAKRAVTIALIAIAWIGFLVAVIAGLVVGLVIIVIGFIACWLLVATFAGKKKGDDERQSEPLLRGGDVETDDDVQSRLRKRLEALSESESADAPRDTADGEDA